MYIPLWLVFPIAFIKWRIVFKWTYKNANCLEYINKNPDIELIGELRAREAHASVAPFLRKCGNLPIWEILVIM